LKLSKDGWSGLAVLAASLVLFWLTLGLKDSPLVPIGPGFYPRIVLAVTALLALAVFVSSLKQESEKPKALNYGMVVTMFAVFGLYAVALPWLGFRVATFAYVAAANALLDPPRGLAGWARVAILAAVTSAATYIVFEHYLTVLLPRGRWSGF
jgi:putative tricarboxylic transport membrane protein